MNQDILCIKSLITPSINGESQKQRVLDKLYREKGKWVNAGYFIFGRRPRITRLSDIIYKLRKKGYNIETKRVTNGLCYYRIRDEKSC